MRNYREITFHKENGQKVFCVVFHKNDEQKFNQLINETISQGAQRLTWTFQGRKTILTGPVINSGHFTIRRVSWFRAACLGLTH